MPVQPPGGGLPGAPGCTTQGCGLRHRRKCRYWALKDGCHRGVDCEYLHLDKNRQLENNSNDAHNLVKLKETRTVEELRLAGSTQAKMNYVLRVK